MPQRGDKSCKGNPPPPEVFDCFLSAAATWIRTSYPLIVNPSLEITRSVACNFYDLKLKTQAKVIRNL